MGAEKGSKRSGGFFHLFDRNRKSRKKLFANENISPEGTKQVKHIHDNQQHTRLYLIDSEDIVGVSSVIGGSSYSSVSSVTDDGTNGIRAPGLVARLMGLDPMPTSSVSESLSTPLFDKWQFQDKLCNKRSHVSCTDDEFSFLNHRIDGNKKMPSSPIERFQREMMPTTSRLARSLPITQHKLLSPMKKPGFISAQSAAHIMEAAAKILEPKLQQTFASSSTSLKVCESRESVTAYQKASKITESSSSKRYMESTVARSLRGQPLSKNWNGSEWNTNSSRPCLDSEKNNSDKTTGKGKSISLAIQAKVNVQKRENLGAYTRSISAEENAESKMNQPFQKHKQANKSSAIHTTGVLKQNNQKQNCPVSTEKSARKASISNQKRKKAVHMETSSSKNKTANKLSVNQKNCLSKDLSQKKRSIGFSKQEKPAQANVLIDEQLRLKEDDGGNGADVVSFTFTSPLLKDSDDRDAFRRHTLCETSPGLGADALSVLLEQKLRELTFDIGSPPLLALQESTVASSDVTSTNGQVIGMKESLMEVQGPLNLKLEHDHQQPSPLSVLEVTFSNETCISPETWDGGSKMCSSSVQAQNVAGSNNSSRNTVVAEEEMELTDSASSREHTSKFDNFGLSLDPNFLNNLESEGGGGEITDCEMRRKLLSDCVNECLEVKYNKYFRAGYKSWAKGSGLIGKEMAEELYKEISGWKSMGGECMVDGLVDRDMSSHLGKWTDFETEAFEEGTEIQREILASLIDELVYDLCCSKR